MCPLTKRYGPKQIHCGLVNDSEKSANYLNVHEQDIRKEQMPNSLR